MGANIHAISKDKWAMSVLAWAAKSGSIPIAKKLLDAGADLHARLGQGFYALHAAASFKQAQLLKYFISQGADVNCTNSHGVTAYVSAASAGSVECLKVLAGNGARHHPRALAEAFDNNHGKAVIYLLKRDKAKYQKTLSDALKSHKYQI